VRFSETKSARGTGGKRDSFGGSRRRENLRGQKSQESSCPRLGLILREAKEGNGFSRGRKPLRRRSKVVRFWGKARERREGRETLPRSRERRKALKGEAQERWGLKEVPEVEEGTEPSGG
jgi:hypothetical protein